MQDYRKVSKRPIEPTKSLRTRVSWSRADLQMTRLLITVIPNPVINRQHPPEAPSRVGNDVAVTQRLLESQTVTEPTPAGPLRECTVHARLWHRMCALPCESVQ